MKLIGVMAAVLASAWGATAECAFAAARRDQSQPGVTYAYRSAMSAAEYELQGAVEQWQAQGSEEFGVLRQFAESAYVALSGPDAASVLGRQDACGEAANGLVWLLEGVARDPVWARSHWRQWGPMALSLPPAYLCPIGFPAFAL